MNRDPIELAFNPDTMTVRDLKTAVKCLRDVFRDFDRCHEIMGSETATPKEMNKAGEDLWLAILQVRGSYKIDD